MANHLKVNPATDGSNDSKAMERVAAVLHDSEGNDINSSNSIPITKPELRQEVDCTDGSVIYMVYAKLGSETDEDVWKIKRVTISGALITTEWADSNTNFDNIWDNRGTLTYG
jgi:hypothetical protein